MSDNLIELDETSFNSLITRFKEKQTLHRGCELGDAFHLLADRCLLYMAQGYSRSKPKFFGSARSDVIARTCYRCFERLDKFDSEKGKAFNYFTTIILNHLRQEYRSIRDEAEQARLWGKYLP